MGMMTLLQEADNYTFWTYKNKHELKNELFQEYSSLQETSWEVF